MTNAIQRVLGFASRAPQPSLNRIKTKWLDLDFADVAHDDAVMRVAMTGSSSRKQFADKIKEYQRKGAGGLNYILYRDPAYDLYFSELFETYVPGEALASRSLVDVQSR
jgi:hypothetical protein